MDYHWPLLFAGLTENNELLKKCIINDSNVSGTPTDIIIMSKGNAKNLYCHKLEINAKNRLLEI